MIWPHATKQNPCPVCNGTDWCQFGDKSILCQRVASSRPALKSGHYHPYDGSKPAHIPKSKPIPKPINAAFEIQESQRATTSQQIERHALDLGVDAKALIYLNCAWSQKHNAWAFPMRDGDGNMIGIRLRNNVGFKWCVTGSLTGIFIPTFPPNFDSRACYLPEGPTNTAAMLSMGLYAIGRPSCNTGAEYLKVALKRLKFSRVVIVADNDDLKGREGSEFRPGIDGARKLKKDLGLQSVIWIPPTKDARDFLRNGGTKEVIESDLKNKIWSKG